jgi:hypothetical protein
MAEQDLDSGKRFLSKLSSWFRGTSLPDPTSSPSEASTAPTVKNKAVMAFEELPTGTIFCAPEGQELITMEIRLPVNPAEDTAWSKSVSRDFASVLSMQTQYSHTLERALYLIAQAVEHDRFEQRSKGQIGTRDPDLFSIESLSSKTIRCWQYLSNPSWFHIALLLFTLYRLSELVCVQDELLNPLS